MKLSISNIAWDSENDGKIYALMKKYGFSGLEIAPSKIISTAPYSHADIAAEWSASICEQHNLCISSMQSLWYGRTEKIWGGNEELGFLIQYTKQAIDFAYAIKCNHIVFGCPKNRIRPEGAEDDVAVSFFKAVDLYADEHDVWIGIEANPPIYNTNFLNTTKSAISFIRKAKTKRLSLNLDVGTIIENREDLNSLYSNSDLIRHVHISEPFLKPIIMRHLHKELNDLLNKINYRGFVSIEMSKPDSLYEIESAMKYVSTIFR